MAGKSLKSWVLCGSSLSKGGKADLRLGTGYPAIATAAGSPVSLRVPESANPTEPAPWSVHATNPDVDSEGMQAMPGAGRSLRQTVGTPSRRSPALVAGRSRALRARLSVVCGNPTPSVDRACPGKASAGWRDRQRVSTDAQAVEATPKGRSTAMKNITLREVVCLTGTVVTPVMATKGTTAASTRGFEFSGTHRRWRGDVRPN